MQRSDVLSIALGVDDARSNEALVRFVVDQAVGMRVVVHVEAFALHRFIDAVRPGP
jgi:hypothetical protein